MKAAILLMLLLAACQAEAGRATAAEEAVAITNRYWSEKYPDVKADDLIIQTTDVDGRWRVTYDPPETWAGAQWIFHVDKKSGNIVSVSGGQ